VVNGQKVWSSGAAYAEFGELICRTDPSVPKHRGMTAFIVPMDAPGIAVRPIRQMSGGASFNEVFLTDVRIPDRLRLGAEGEGWKVALTTLGFERSAAASGGGSGRVGGSLRQVLELARHLERGADPVLRQRLARLYIDYRLLGLNAARASAAARAGRPPGPESSIGKLARTTAKARMSDVVTTVLGPRLTADSGEWGTYAWAEHVLGAPGYRIAGGSDEIQRNIIAERVLGLPTDPKR
jgi:alkylation response protein AidB-like acyl-CoA dehydrogenase